MTRRTGAGARILRVGVVGAGRMGTALARMAMRAGHHVTIGSRTPERARRIASEHAAGTDGTLDGGSYADAARGADLVILSCLWEDVPRALDEAEVAPGTIVLDAGNPEAPDGRSLVLGHETSAAEWVQARLPGARVVKAFNHVYAEIVDAGGKVGGIPVTVFLCGDDARAKATVARFAVEGGFRPVDAGPLRNARYLEPTAQLMVQLVREQGFAPQEVALHLVEARRQSVP